MARHGECAEVGSLKRKIPDLGEVGDPESFAGFLRKKGYEVISTPLPTQKGEAREVNVPQMDLYLVFVTAEFCGEVEKR